MTLRSVDRESVRERTLSLKERGISLRSVDKESDRGFAVSDRSKQYYPLKIMTYTAEIQTVEAHGIPTTEYRVAPDLEPQIITIEFYPPSHPDDEFDYPHPKFKFWEEVARVDDWGYCLDENLNPDEEINIYQVCALHLVANRTNTGLLREPPYWLYGVCLSQGSQKVRWFAEAELIAKRDISLAGDTEF